MSRGRTKIPSASFARNETASKHSLQILSNHEVVVLAAYLANAHISPADTEDVAVKANELAPGRFTWRKYADQINIDTVRKRLWDAAKTEKGGYLLGSERNGWRLTQAGFDFAERHLRESQPSQLLKQRSSRNERAASSREIKRMTMEDAYRKFVSGFQREITKSEAEHFFRVDDYVTGKSRRAKIERFKIITAGNSTLSQVISFLSKLVEEK